MCWWWCICGGVEVICVCGGGGGVCVCAGGGSVGYVCVEGICVWLWSVCLWWCKGYLCLW